MVQTKPMVLITDNGDGSADLTISINEDDHKFSIVEDGDTARVSYEESSLWRGQIMTSSPSQEVWRMVLQSDEVTEFLERNELDGVRRER